MIITDGELDRFLAEDVPYGDLTTHALGMGAAPGRMVFRARKAMVVSSTEEAARLIARTGAVVRDVLPSGSHAEADAILLVAEGRAGALLASWKVAQTLVEAASGMATGARAMVDAARIIRPGIVVACTRKAFPGTRAIAVKAILSGGAVPHRLGLSETVLVFPEHRAFLTEPLAVTLAKLQAACPEKKLVVEVNTVEEAEDSALAGAHVVQLEKFPPSDVAVVVARLAQLAPLVKVAAAGGVTAANAADYARAGAHVLVTSSPYLAPPMDVAVSILPA
ncbi:MAG: ModD protein [Rhodospirillaceae bacterium]|nr:ModD protein [Rhodospirillales bacterium]